MTVDFSAVRCVGEAPERADGSGAQGGDRPPPAGRTSELPFARGAAPAAATDPSLFAALVDVLPGTLFRLANDGYPAVDGPWRAVYVTGHCEPLTGYRPDQLVGAGSHYDLLHADDYARVMDELRHALLEGHALRTTYRIFDRAGTERWVWEQSRGVYLGSAIVALDGFLADVTERRRNERVREDRSLEAGVTLAARTFEHELRNRLAVTTGYTEALARDSSIPQAVRQRAERAHVAAMDAARIVGELVDGTRRGHIDWGTTHGTTIDVGSR